MTALSARARVVLGGAVVVGVLAGLAGGALIRVMVDAGLYGDGVAGVAVSVLIALVGMFQGAAPVFASVASRVPFAGVAVAGVIAVVLLVAQPALFGGGFGMGPVDVLLWVLGVATVLVVDLVVRSFRGRDLPFVPPALAAFGTAVLGVAVVLGQYVAIDGPDLLGLLLRSPTFVLDVVVIQPVALVAAAAVGWTLRPTPASPEVPSAG